MAIVRLFRCLIWAVCLALAGLAVAQEDPPGRVGRLAVLQGEVLVLEAERGDWEPALPNRPLTGGDRLWTAPGASAELRIGSSVLWLGAQTELEAARLDDQRLQFRLQRGQLAVLLRSDTVAAEFEVAHPEVRLQPLRAGLYRIDRLAEATDVSVWRGALRVDGHNLTTTLVAGQRAAFWRDGPLGDTTRQWLAPQQDEFALAVQRADQEAQRLAAATWVPPEMTGAEELERYGRWQQHPEYGAVWLPMTLAPGWVPYQRGRWLWLRPWGWTWVDDAPWGFATSHYGRWFWWGQQWVWTPGPRVPRPVFSPAVVGWVNGPPPAWRPGLKPPPPQGWVALGPHERYVPVYRHPPGSPQRPLPGWPQPPGTPGWQPPVGLPTPEPRPPGAGAPPRPSPPPGAGSGPFFGRPFPTTPPHREPLIRPTVPPVAVTMPAAPPAPGQPAPAAPPRLQAPTPAPVPAPPRSQVTPADRPPAADAAERGERGERRRPPEQRHPFRER